jgi:hypothetical protein
MCLKEKVIIDILQEERAGENRGQPKLVVLKFGFGWGGCKLFTAK